MKAKQKIIKDKRVRELMYKEFVSRARFVATISLIAMVSILISCDIYLANQAPINLAPLIMLSTIIGAFLVITVASVGGWYFAKEEEYSKILQVK